MTYVKTSTANPLGRKPWDAILQPGGLGAFFPNAQAIGTPSLIVDRDAGNVGGWKGAAYAGAPVPRVYYPPDARLQFRNGAGLGAFAIHSGIVGANPPRAITPSTVTPGSLIWARTEPVYQSTSNVSTAPAAPVSASTVVPSSTTPAGITALTTASGATVHQQTGSTAAQTSGTPVPVGQPVTQAYTDSSGNTWLFNGITWYNASAQVAGTPVPVGTSTTTTFTDSSGNVWTFNGSTWTSATAAASATSASSWFTESTIFSALPNYVVLGGAGLLAYLMFRKK